MTDTAALRATARELFDAGVAEADPTEAVRRSLNDHPIRPDRIIAVGKAALSMARASLEALPSLPPTVVVTNEENVASQALDHGRVLIAGHPVPDANGAAAAREIETFAAQAGEGETVLVLVSGGASAMLPAPIEGISLRDKIETTETLLGCGAPIDAINIVRRALSRLKGGGLGRAIHPAQTVALLLSDVPHDNISAIGSGPTVPEPSPAENVKAALAVLERYALTERIPKTVRHVLEKNAILDEGKADQLLIENRLIGGNGLSLDAMSREAERKGLAFRIVSRWLDGDVSDAARTLHAAATEAPKNAIALLAGGETTVVLRGNGKGGRNQELALRFAMLCEAEPLDRPWAFLSGGTDGRDGPTTAAGGVVDASALDRIRAVGSDPNALLANNDSFAALKAAGDLLVTGATGTNVADLQVLVLGKLSHVRSKG